jgi:hypothetical protein
MRTLEFWVVVQDGFGTSQEDPEPFKEGRLLKRSFPDVMQTSTSNRSPF